MQGPVARGATDSAARPQEARITEQLQYEDQLRGGRPLPGARSALALLFALMVVDFVDRQVVVAVFPHLKAAWMLSDAQLGALVSVISTVIALASVPLSLLADRWGHVKSIFVMALVWSFATIACAYARDYHELLLARGFVGLGEAAYAPVGAALLARLFPMRMRATVLGVFLSAAVVGSMLGVALGGVLAERWGWHAVFGLVGPPGVLLAIVLLVGMHRHERPAHPGLTGASPAPVPVLRAIAAFVESRTAMVTCIASGLQFATVWAMYAWIPSYLNRFYGVSAARAGAEAAVLVLVGGVGAVVWSLVADRMVVRDARARLHVPAFAALATGILMLFAFAALAPGMMQLAVVLAAGLVMTGSIGPCPAVVIDVVHPAMRATAAALLAVTGNLLGMAMGPFVAGALSDAYGLTVALAVMPVFSFIAAAGFVVAARSYVADRDRAGRAGVSFSYG